MHRGDIMDKILIGVAVVIKAILVYLGVSSVISLIDGFVNAAIIYMFLLYTLSFIFSRGSDLYTRHKSSKLKNDT